MYEKLKPSPQFQSYARLTRALFESIRAVSGKPVIVDSSKAPIRAFAFAMVPGIDVRMVHLVRDGRGVMASRRKTFQQDLQAGIEWDHKGHPLWKSGIRWLSLHLISEWVGTQLGPTRTVRLRYEDFVEDPKNALNRISSLIELDLTEVAAAASTGETMQVGHNIGGNRVRKSESVKVRPVAGEWKNALSTTEQQLSWWLMGWLLRRYGYERS